MKGASATLLMVGDIILDEPEPDSFFALAQDVLRSGDVVVGHVEVPHTRRGSEQSTDIPAPPADPANLAAMASAGFNVATLAGNHIYDSGAYGIEDTVQTLTSLGIATTGANSNLPSAKAPAIITKNNIRVGVLSYNCVGPKESWATSKKAGCAYINVLTHYELDYATPGGPPTIYTFVAPESIDAMNSDIGRLRTIADIVVVAFHKGVGHVPAKIEMYELAVGKAAVDAGADIVIGHHAHIMRGIEIYRGKPIYHGLGNFVCVTRALSISANDSPERQAWAVRRQKLFGFVPDPDMPTYPFHPESRNTIIARCVVDRQGVIETGFVPCYIDQQAKPRPLTQTDGGGAVVDYVSRISAAAGFKTQFEWQGDWVKMHTHLGA